MPRPRRTALVLLLLLLVAACSGGSGKARSDEVVLGFVNMEGSPAGSFPEASAGARAAASFVNDELGGVSGKRLRLKECRTDGTPESSQDCAQQLLAASPLAVVGGIDLGADASVPVVTRAGVPYVTGSPTLAAELTTTGAYALTGGVAADLLAIADHLISTEHVRSIHVVHEDLPGLLNAAISAAGEIFRKQHVDDVKLVAEKADAADFAPALSSAAAGDPDAIIVVFPAQACARIMRTARALHVTARMYYPGVCASQQVVQAGGGDLSRTFFASGYVPVGGSGGDADAAAFRARVPAGQRSPVSEAAFSAVLDVARLAAAGAGDASALANRLESTKDQPNALAHPYTCDRKQLAKLKSVCNSWVRLLQVREGAFVDVLGTWVSGARLNALLD